MPNSEHYRRLDLIVENTTNMVVVTNANREIEWVNPAYTRVTGWTLEEVKGRNPKSFLHGPRTSLEAAKRLGERLRRGLPVKDYEMLNYAKNGTPYWVSLSIQPIAEADGKVAEYVAIQSDITERKQREVETARAYRRLAEAQRIAGLGYMEHDLTTGRIECSPEIYRIIDADDSAIGPSYEELMACAHPEDFAEVRQRYEDAINAGLPYASEHRVLSKTGRVKWVQMRGMLEGWDDGSPALCRLVVQDITERKQAEEVAHEKARLEQVAQTQMEILSRVSHELRTPLHAVSGLTDIVERQDGSRLSPRSQTHLGHIRMAAKHLLDIVNDVLDLNHIHEGQINLELQPLDTQAVALEVLALLEPLAHERHQSLGLASIDQQSICVQADRLRLRQVLINLVGNGLKYTPAGGRVSVRCRQASPAWVQIEITDNGVGIAAEHLKRLFEPFYRVPSAQSFDTATQGSGLGLAIAQTLARSMGGEISVETKVGCGSCFKLLLPLAQPSTDGGVDSVRSGAHPEATGQLLYIEDNEVNRLLIEHYLSARPELKLECYATGKDGLAAARRLRPSVILVDMQLPDMSGHEVMQAVLDDPELYRTPCVAFSAEASEVAVASAIGRGFRDYLCKPIGAGDFLRAIDRLIHETQPSLMGSL